MKYLKLFENEEVKNAIIEAVKGSITKERIKSDIMAYIKPYIKPGESSTLTVILFHLISTSRIDYITNNMISTPTPDVRGADWTSVAGVNKIQMLIGGKYVDYFMEGLSVVIPEIRQFETEFLKPLVYDCFAEIIADCIEFPEHYEGRDYLKIYLDNLKDNRLPKGITNHPLLIQYARGRNSGLLDIKI